MQPVLTDTFPLVPLLSGHVRLGVSWYWRFRRGIGITLQPGLSWYRQVMRATNASTVPYVERVPEGYRWLKYRLGAVSLQGGVRWQQERPGELFPRYWIEAGGWIQRRLGSSLKYVAVREGRTEKVRWEGLSLFSPWQGGVYVGVGRQWIGASVYYHLLSLVPKEIYEPTGRLYPRPPSWEVGFLLAL
ncbi:MAG: hypothetical protein N2170_00210 [Bacteroidia bacterium]|nr:hypothetical protein [Bacteroidia bacterium]